MFPPGTPRNHRRLDRIRAMREQDRQADLEAPGCDMLASETEALLRPPSHTPAVR